MGLLLAIYFSFSLVQARQQRLFYFSISSPWPPLPLLFFCHIPIPLNTFYALLKLPNALFVGLGTIKKEFFFWCFSFPVLELEHDIIFLLRVSKPSEDNRKVMQKKKTKCSFFLLKGMKMRVSINLKQSLPSQFCHDNNIMLSNQLQKENH